MLKRKAPSNSDGARANTKTPKQQRKTQNSTAASLHPIIPADVRSKFHILTKTMTIELSLLGRASPGVCTVLNYATREFSQASQVASRLAAFAVRKILASKDSPAQQIARLGTMFEPTLSTGARGASFFTECQNLAANPKKARKYIDDDVFAAFQTQFGAFPAVRIQRRKAFIQQSFRAVWTKDMLKLVADRLATKPRLWIHHRLRKEGWNALIDHVERLRTCEVEAGQTPHDTLDSRARKVLAQVGRHILSVCWTHGTTAENYIELQGYPADLCTVAIRTAKCLGKWLECLRISGIDSLRHGAKTSTHAALWVLYQISKEFAVDSEHRRCTLAQFAGADDEIKRQRRTAMDQLHEWQRATPAKFALLPIKRGHAVDFMHITASSAGDLIAHMAKSAPNAGTPFWWKDLITLGDWDGGGGSREEFDVAVASRRQNPSNFKSSGNRKGQELALLRGVATSPKHLLHMQRRAEWHKQQGRAPCHPLVVTGFRTNGRELHIIVEKLSRKAGSSSPHSPVQRVQTHGFDLIDRRGFAALSCDDDDDNDEECSQGRMFEPAIDTQGIFAQAKASETNIVATVVDPGQIHPLATVRAEFDANECKLSTPVVITEKDFHGVRGSLVATNQEMSQYGARVAEPQDNPLCEDGDEILAAAEQHRNQVEGAEWSTIDALLNGTPEETRTIRRDQAWRRKRQRKEWVRRWAKEQKDAGAHLVAFGNGQCRSRGHRSVPTKAIIRQIATMMPVLVLDEFGTSSRCPACQVPEKLKRGKKESTTQQVSTGAVVFSDERIEICSRCHKAWGHDEVSVVNLSYVTQSLLRGHSRPHWLRRV